MTAWVPSSREPSHERDDPNDVPTAIGGEGDRRCLHGPDGPSLGALATTTGASSEATVAGETYGSDDKFRWTRTGEEYYPPEIEETEDLAVAAYRVTVVVKWPGKVRARRLNLTTIKLDRAQRVGG